MSEIEEIIEQGEHAEKLMNNPAYESAIKAIKDEAMNDFANSLPTDVEKRQAAYFTLKAIEKLDLRIRGMVFNGNFEQEKAKRGRPRKV